MSKTVDFFKEICNIPRESGNELEISNYLVKFACDRNLPYIRDDYNNVIIKKYVNDKEPIILQAHMDMVCVSNNNFDFNNPIDIYEEDGYIKAHNTSLGADNGVGLAQILNILDSDIDVSIEAIFTVSEETTMIGAEKIDLSSLKGKKMLNLDGFNADTILIEAASFTDIDIKTNYKFSDKSNNLYKISISGLPGGHSGFDIDKDIPNSIKILVDILSRCDNLQISEFAGGTKINVIPSDGYCIIKCDNINNIINEYKEFITIEEINDSYELLSSEDSSKFIKSLLEFHHGVFNKNDRDEVTTSENLAYVDLDNNIIRIGLRSSIDSEREEVVSKLKSICKSYDYEFIITGYQPGFSTSEDSNLVKDLITSYYGDRPKLESVHVAVEVGLIKEKIPDLEVAIISPNIIGAHSTDERVEISSINKCDEWLFNFLDNKRR